MADKGNFKLGAWAFIIGLILAIIVAIIGGGATPEWAMIVLAILGVIVGLLNVTSSEVQKFLVAAIAFLLSFSALGTILTKIALNWQGIGAFFNLLSIFMAPAAAVVAIKALFSIAKN
jgi:hypothetical protein